MRERIISALCLSWLASCGVESAAESTAADAEQVRGVRHVLLISIDGMHEVDLARFLADHPGSRLAELAATGVEFTNAWVNRLDGSPTNPSDSFPGLLALTTGGSSPTTGGWYDVSYARDLFPDASCATPGTAVAYDEGAELDNTNLFGAPGAAVAYDEGAELDNTN